ncbi:hypothetical protein [Bacillus cereus]|uniref:hypothetical protein n=2 Tax=Bacillus cereus TaxID=1396 RepID=UPI000BF9ECFD|nr:hypothetical protein [Bacillus cereus]PFQ29132.1 hypothetical protein COK16_07395 [Bacillus cereus]PGR80522.1 hypothetical protein COC63_12565 [Bacillus cereus]
MYKNYRYEALLIIYKIAKDVEGNLMINKLMEIDENLKRFLYEKLHDQEITSKEKILIDGYTEGFDELTILNALQICLENKLIDMPSMPLNIGNSQKDFFINKPQLYILKS